MVHAQIGHTQTYNIHKCNILYAPPVQNNKIMILIEFYFSYFLCNRVSKVLFGCTSIFMKGYHKNFETKSGLRDVAESVLLSFYIQTENVHLPMEF